MWWQLFWAIVIAIVSSMLAPTPPAPESAQPDNPDGLPTIDDTQRIPVLFGTKELHINNVLWFGDLKTTAIVKTPEGGGKK